jgi:hypothetical protein
MDRCPACNAKVREKMVCRRCKTDLSLLIAVEDRAARHTEQARQAFQSADFKRMFFHAKRACSLRATPESRVLLAAAALLTRRFDAALGLWKQHVTKDDS